MEVFYFSLFSMSTEAKVTTVSSTLLREEWKDSMKKTDRQEEQKSGHL